MRDEPVQSFGSTMGHRSNNIPPETLDEFLAQTERRAFRMAMLASGDREDSHEIVQEAMLKLAHRYAKRPSDEWPMLFHRIMQNEIRDWYRRQKVRKQWRRWFGHEGADPDEDPLDQLPAEHVPGPEQAFDVAQKMHRVEESLLKLPLRQRQAFLLRAWEGLDVRETAKAMSCSEGSVKTHYSRAIHALRDQLKGVVE